MDYRVGTRHFAVVAALAVAAFGQAHGQTITPVVFTSPPASEVGPGTIGFAYAGDMFVGSVYRGGTSALYSTDLTGGSQAVFAPTVSIPGGGSTEHFVASSLGLGGFPSRDIYVAGTNDIIHISHDGSAGSTFASGFSGGVRGILFDSIGSFAGDMLVTTTTGDVYRVNSAGTVTFLASTKEDTEGLDIAPLGAGFGAFDGQLIVASEGSGKIRAISTTGVVTDLTTVASAEELTFVPLDLGVSGDPVEGFYGANYTPNVVFAGASQFFGGTFDYRGDVIVTGETTHRINDVHWNGSAFVVTDVGGFPNQPEDGIFVTHAIVRGGVPEPGILSMFFGCGVAGSLFGLRRLRARKVAAE